jgi:iron complex outermembrane receptor protein
VALCSATMGLFVSTARGEDVPATAAGDVSASEATPLPPIEVTSPSQPITKKKTSKKSGQSGASGGAAGEGSGDTTDGEGAGSDGMPGIFTLGQLDMIGGSTVSNQAMWTFNTNTLEQAAAIAPGVSMVNYGGTRNERDVYVRGFDRWRVPLTLDGARIYLPADNRLDLARFLTPDLAEIQIEKGYVSVLNGPGGMGGSINLVSRKPTKAFESEARVGATFDGDLASRNSVTGYGRVGTKQDLGYAQISGTIVDLDQWNLSDDFKATSVENGGMRDGSDTRDWRVNAKVGYTPNSTDEYAFSYTKQSGEKGAPLHVLGSNRYWQWPTWDIESFAAFSHTKVGEASYVKANAYYNNLNNSLRSFNSASYNLQNLRSTFDSWYDDYAYGGMIEAGTNLIPMNTLKVAAHYRYDNHVEHNFNSPDGGTWYYLEPLQETEEKNWSFAVENTFHATKWFDIVAGASRDYAKLLKAEEFESLNNNTVHNFIYRPTGEMEAWNWQSAAIMRYSDDGKVYATISDRTRFPTIFERYSTRFGTATPNPDLGPEEATNYEVGWSDTFNNKLKMSGAIFYTEISDAIQSVVVGMDNSTNPPGQITQNQNVGDGTHKGIEVSVDYDLVPGLRVGGNYTYLKREIHDPLRPTLKAEGTPEHEAFVYLAWDATRDLTITPSLELASDRWSLLTRPNAPANTYIEVGSYALVNLNVEYRVNETFTLSAGGKNLTDEDYMLVEGFPEPGRYFFANAKAEF